MSVTEATKAALSTRREIVGNLIGNALPPIGLGLAVIVNIAWLGLLGYIVFKLV
jgi:hypothetical protein